MPPLTPKASGPLTVTVDGSSFGTLSSINLYEATAPGALALDVTGSADTQYVYSKALAYVSTSAPAKSGDVSSLRSASIGSIRRTQLWHC